MASGRHIMPLMCSSMLRNRDMMPLFSMTTGYMGRVPASVSAALTTAFTPPKVTTPREILHLHKRLLSHITENSVIYADRWNIKNFKHIKHRFLHPYLEKRVAGVYSAIAPFSGLWSFSFISVRGGKKANLSAGWTTMRLWEARSVFWLRSISLLCPAQPQHTIPSTDDMGQRHCYHTE